MKLAKHTILVGPAIAGLLVLAPPAAAQWTGCGAGVHGGLVSGHLDIGAPIGIGSEGQAAGVSLNCDYKMNAFVAGAYAEYDWVFGDLKTVGVNTDTTLGGRLGVLINAGSLLYVHAGWSRLDVSGLDAINGWKVGLGNEFRVPNSPLYLDLRYSYADYDVKDILGPIPDAHAHTFRLGLNVKFGPGMFGGSGARFATDDPAPRVGVAPAKKCDPKLANC